MYMYVAKFQEIPREEFPPTKRNTPKKTIHLRVCVCDLLIYPSGKGGRKREREKVLVTEMYKGGEREWNGEKTLRDEFQGKKGPRNKQKLPFPPLRPRVFLEFQSTSASLKKTRKNFSRAKPEKEKFFFSPISGLAVLFLRFERDPGIKSL